jgi:hypothetical protein
VGLSLNSVRHARRSQNPDYRRSEATLPHGRKGPKNAPNQPVGLDLGKELLEGYAAGKPVGSEIVGFSQIVEDAKQQDTAKAEILDRGFSEIRQLMNKPAAIPAKAKEVLAQLQK